MPSVVPGDVVGSSVPPADTTLSWKGSACAPETSVRVDAEWSVGGKVAAWQLTQKLVPLLALTFPVLASATTVPKESVAPDATVHISAACAWTLAEASMVNSALRARRRSSDRIERAPWISTKLSAGVMARPRR